VIQEYRSSDSPLVREKGLAPRRRRDRNQRAADRSARPETARSGRELIQGHLIRIDLRGRAGPGARPRGDPPVPERRGGLRRGRSLPRLAALHAYAQHDVEQTDADVAMIASKGLAPGRRERAERADARLLSAADLWADRGSIAGLPEEKEYLEKIRARLSEAIDLYGTVLGFENAHLNLRKARGLMDRVDDRLSALQAERRRHMNMLQWLLSFGGKDAPSRTIR
jgi:hypothetical protein